MTELGYETEMASFSEYKAERKRRGLRTTKKDYQWYVDLILTFRRI